MTTIDKVERKLGFDKIRNSIATLCSTQSAKKRVSEISFLTHPSKIEEAQTLTEEMRQILLFDTPFPDSGFVDILPLFKELENSNSYLDSSQLFNLKIGLETLRKVSNYFKEERSRRYPSLSKMLSALPLFPAVENRVETIIDRFGNIKDNASVELASIRRAIKEHENSASKLLKAILQRGQQEGIIDIDAALSVREGRVLIPVDAANKRKIKGFVIDQSGSGRTVYIEPLEVVELNNYIKELHFAEAREIEKILIEFAIFLREYLPELTISFLLLVEIEFIKAKAHYAVKIGAAKPILNREGELILKEGRHPLLEAVLAKEGKRVVPLSLSLNKESRILLISGPNAGGKSVALKTVGALQYMFQSGLPIPASQSSELPLFQSFFVEIGDEQSLENDLSTYSSHLKNMREILDKANDQSLILIDEFGSGTEPSAGGAIAEAILEELEGRGSFAVITTHYTNLKLYAGSSRGVKNGGMLFDVQNIMPLFKLEIGTPGISFAFELARKMGIPEKLVAKAQERVGSDFVDMERQLRRISRSRRAIDEKLKRVTIKERELLEITDKYAGELKDVKELKRGIISEAKKEASQLLSQTNRVIERTIKEIREVEAEKERTKAAREKLDKFKEGVAASDKRGERGESKVEKKLKEIEGKSKSVRPVKKVAPKSEKSVETKAYKVGDRVKVSSSGVVGEVVEVTAKQLIIAAGSLLTRVDISKVSRLSNKEYNDILAVSNSGKRAFSVVESGEISQRRLNFKPSIDLRGERVEAALDKITAFVDDAIMVGVDQIKILHGKGSGVLKEEIRRYLKSVWGISSFKDEDVERGGAGITVVDLTKL